MNASSQASRRSSPGHETQLLSQTWNQALQQLGPEPLLCAPMMTLDSGLFPDPWKENLESARRVVVRALAYMGVSVDDVGIVAVDEESQERPPRLGHNQALPAWFSEWKEQVPQIKLDSGELNKPSVMLAALVRASVHAYLVRESKLKGDAHDDALLDLMGICMGWGIVLTHASHVLIQSSGRAKYIQLTQLPPGAMATSLAWVTAARRLEAKSVKGIARALAPNQREAFDRAYRATRAGDIAMPGVFQDLGAPQTWPPMWDLEARVSQARKCIKALAPLPQQDAQVGVERGIVGKNKGKAVFMVRRRLSMRIMKFGVGAVFAVSMLLSSDPSIEVDRAQIMLGGGAFVLLGGLVGRFMYEQRCSDAKCDARLKDSDTVCPRCGGTISGVISNAKERLAAEEELPESVDA